MISVRVTRVPDGGVPLKEARHLELGELGLGDPFDAEGVAAEWELVRLMGKVYGKMKARGRVHLDCGRCLSAFSLPVEADFAVLFEPRARAGGRNEPEAKEVVVEEDAGPSAVFFDGEELPLGEELRQELELAVPYSGLCGPDCKGLCARCGANLNVGACACPADEATGPFSGLRHLQDP